jgi:rubrerythrin
MTKKEAIKLLSWVLNEWAVSEDLKYHGVSVKEALKIAIKALKQEKKGANMRLIDANELMEHVWRDRLDNRELIAKMIDTAPTIKEIPTKIPINMFEQLISQKPQKNTGKWIYTGDYITEGMLKCSECDFEHDVSERFLYCPNCGAKMEIEE